MKLANVDTDKYDFKLKGRRFLRGRYFELLRTPPLCDFTLKWSNFFSIGRISGLEKYVMFQHHVCLCSRNFFDFVCFLRLWSQNNNFWLFFNLNGLYWWETDKVKKNSTKMKSLGRENIFSFPCATKAQKLTAVGLFKVESVVSKSLKIAKKS